MTIQWCIVPEILGVTDRYFCHFGPFLHFNPPYQPKISKFWKNFKNVWRYYHFTHVYHKLQSYDIWFLRYWGAQQTEFFVIFDKFLPIYPLKTWKIKILKKWKKKPGHIIILQKCTKNQDHMLYCSWDMAHDRCNCYFSF